MASISSLHRWASNQHSRLPRITSISEADQSRPINQVVAFSVPISRRDASIILLSSIPLTSFFVLTPSSSEARERRSRKVIPLEEYSTGPEGLKFYDIEEGKGPVATEGSTAQVSLANDSHFNFSISKSSSRFYNVMVSVFSTFRCILIAVTEASLQFLPENPSF
jgi:hypothetical protein